MVYVSRPETDPTSRFIGTITTPSSAYLVVPSPKSGLLGSDMTPQKPTPHDVCLCFSVALIYGVMTGLGSGDAH